MNNNDLKILSESLINTFNFAGEESIRLYKEGLKIEIKKDKTPVSNGDIRVNDLISAKIKELTPDIPIISEENYIDSYREKLYRLLPRTHTPTITEKQ